MLFVVWLFGLVSVNVVGWYVVFVVWCRLIVLVLFATHFFEL